MNNEALKNLVETGTIPYRYEYDSKSGLYFGLAILAVIFVYAITFLVTKKIIG